MGQLGSFVAWAAESTKTVDFAVIYLEEAHPTDGWLYPAVKHFIKQHKSAGERSKAATILEEELASLAETHQTQAIPVFADSMSNAASLAFGALLRGRTTGLASAGEDLLDVRPGESSLAHALPRTEGLTKGRPPRWACLSSRRGSWGIPVRSSMIRCTSFPETLSWIRRTASIRFSGRGGQPGM